MARRRKKAASCRDGHLQKIIKTGKQEEKLKPAENQREKESTVSIPLDDGELPEDWPTAVMRAFFDHHGVVSQNIESFNKFLTTHIHDIITKEPIAVECYNTEPFPVRHEIHFTKESLGRPCRDEGDGHPKVSVFPNDCLNRSLTYASELYAQGYIKKYELQNGVPVPVPLSNAELKEQQKGMKGSEPMPVYEKPFFVYLGKIPVMVKSVACHLSSLKEEREFQKKRECFLDPGGYFIISGRERVLVAQEKLPENRPVVYKVMSHSNYECECEIRSSVENSLRPVNALWIRLLRDRKIKCGKVLPGDDAFEELAEVDDDAPGAATENVAGTRMPTGKQVVVIIPRLQKPIPLVLLFKALGCQNLKEIETFITQGDNEVRADRIRQLVQSSLNLWDEKGTRDQAIELIGSLASGTKEELTVGECRALGREILNDHVLQHMGTDADVDNQKIKYLCDMVRRVCEVHLGWRPHDDRDHLVNKRFELPGNLFATLFKRLWRQLAMAVQTRIKKRLEGKDGSINYDMKSIIHPSTITQGFSYSVSTGNWSDRKGSAASTGVSQELNRCCYVSTLSHLRRVTTPGKLHRNIAARQLHSSYVGMICTNETPEGEPVGLVQNFALSAAITVGCNTATISDLMKSENDLTPLEKCGETEMARGCKVFLNGRWLGMHRDAEKLIHALRMHRITNQIPSEVSISVDKLSKLTVEIRTDAGRIYRPVMVIDSNKLKMSCDDVKKLVGKEKNWMNLLNAGIVEELDAAEMMNCHIAMGTSILKRNSKVYTHCEIHPSMIMGLSASTVPFANHNQAPRNTYQSGMAKQAVGLYATNFGQRCDLLSHVMHYPHKPLMTTFGADLCKIWELPAGIECVVAILCYTGYNQEDSLIFNQSSIDRGLLRSSVTQTYVDTENQVSARREQDESFERPEKEYVRYLKTENYSHLDEDGLPSVGTRILERDPVIGKTIDCMGIKRDGSLAAKLNTRGIVAKAFATTNECGQRMHKVLVQEARVPKIGDKFASRHGQKGVIGLTLSQENMPFTKDGLVPDIILNPHAIPSRMTIGHIIEALASKCVCLRPKARSEINATAFSQPLTADTFAKFLRGSGFHEHGEEIFYDGLTGEKLRATVFVGVNYYQRLRHMIDDKLNIRNRGAVTLLEGQPKRGLTRDGAQRFGEMERDCTISHGAAGLLHERLFTVSDAANYVVCCNCGTLTSLDPYVDGSSNSQKSRLSLARYYRCSTCAGHGDNLSTIALPKATKLLYQELLSMNIRPRFKTTADFMRYKLVKL